MGIISRFTDIMSANVNAAMDKAEDKNADKLLSKYLQDAKKNLGNVKAETAAVIAEEMACKRRLDECNNQMSKYEQYAMSAVKAGNDDDARKFLSSKSELTEKSIELETELQKAKENSEKMRQMTQKLADDVHDAQMKINELQAKLTIAKSQEKRNELTGKLGDGIDNFDSLFDKVQKRIDAADVTQTLGIDSNTSEMENLEKKYMDIESGVGSDSVEDELARLKSSMNSGE